MELGLTVWAEVDGIGFLDIENLTEHERIGVLSRHLHFTRLVGIFCRACVIGFFLFHGCT